MFVALVAASLVGGCQNQPTAGDPSQTATVTAKDRDGDGSPKSEDCDDRDPARFPGNPELCDEIDNDCDEAVDEDAVDQVPLYVDADADGVGAGEPVGVGCTAGPGLASSDGDCDDDDPSRAPGLVDWCDGVDNDCLGDVDRDVVPRDHPTLAIAMDLAQTVEICVYPGSYSERLGAIDRDLMLTAPFGPDVTEIALGDGTVPWMTLAAGAHVTVTGFGVGGLDAATGDGQTVSGAFAKLEPESWLTVKDDVFHDNVAEIGDLTEGLLIEGDDATLEIVNVELNRLTVALTGPEPSMWGGLVAIHGGEVDVDGLVARDLDVSSRIGADDCAVGGLLLWIEDADTDIVGVDVADVDVDLQCGAEATSTGLIVRHYLGAFTADACTLQDVVVTQAADTVSFNGLLKSSGSPSVDLAGFTVAQNTINVQGRFYSDSWALIAVEGADQIVVEHLDGSENLMTLLGGKDVFSGWGRGGVLFLDGQLAVLRWVDLRDNTLDGYYQAYGTGVYSLVEQLFVTNAVFAGNSARCSPRNSHNLTPNGSGAGLHGEYGPDVPASVRITNADFVSNTVDCVDSLAAGLRLVDFSGEVGLDAPPVTIWNSTFVGNTIVAGCLSPTGATANDDNLEFTYSNVYDNVCLTLPRTEFSDGLITEGVDGILSADPLYVDVSSVAADDWDLSLGAGSPLIDAGDPIMLDADGTQSDMGAYGGPDGAAW